MLRHIALFRWNTATTAEDVSRIEEALDTWPRLKQREAIQYIID